MSFSIKFTNLGVQIRYGHDSEGPPQRSPDADQQNPRGHYVYAHVDRSGKVFYIGKGVGSRAWSTDRHPLWTRYVERHLNNEYAVEILVDNLTEDEAEQVEADWISHYGSQLVNWVNASRETDFKALEVFHQRRNANRELMQQARAMEKTNLEQAAAMYIDAIAAIPSYALIKYEGGLVGTLMDEEQEETGRFGEIEALDRLSMCLIKLGRVREAVERADKYFSVYRGDLNRAAAQRIAKRLRKAVARLRDS
jgi:hypothetical protein